MATTKSSKIDELDDRIITSKIYILVQHLSKILVCQILPIKMIYIDKLHVPCKGVPYDIIMAYSA